MTDAKLHDEIYAAARKLSRLLAEAHARSMPVASDEFTALTLVAARIRALPTPRS
jgi:hypothetical protein